jgi:ubiquinol-cytochrome c reductase cytochrome b subunit
VALLTWLAVAEDRSKPEYVAAVKAADFEAERVLALAQAPSGIPTAGAVTLLRADPLVQGPKLFARNCASCHRYDGHDGLGLQPKDKQSASDLKGFATREWLEGLLNPATVDSVKYMGGSKHKDGEMVKWVKENVPTFNASSQEQLKQALTALSAEAGLKSQKAADLRDVAIIGAGAKLLVSHDLGCIDCHTVLNKSDGGEAPDLTGFGSRQWLTAFISNPKHESFYGERNDRMPAFGADGRLTETEIGLIADWLRGDWYVAPAAP